MSKEPVMPTATNTEEPMSLETAVDLASNIVTKFAAPLVKLHEVLQVAKDSKNMIAAYTEQIPVIEGRIAALKIEEAGANARATNSKARADSAEDAASLAVADSQRKAGEAQAAARQTITDAESQVQRRLGEIEALYTTKKTELEGHVTLAEQHLAALKGEYNTLMDKARAKFGTP